MPGTTMKGNLLAWEEPDKACKVNFQPFSAAVQTEDKGNTGIRTNNNLGFLEALIPLLSKLIFI